MPLTMKAKCVTSMCFYDGVTVLNDGGRLKCGNAKPMLISNWLFTCCRMCDVCRYKGKRFSAAVEVCTQRAQVEEFCRQTCIKLECCPLLVSPRPVSDVCPENCWQLTKTKYSQYSSIALASL